MSGATYWFVISSPAAISFAARKNLRSPINVRIVFGRHEWFMYEACVQKPLRSSGFEFGGWFKRSEDRVGAEKQLRRRMYSTRNLLYVNIIGIVGEGDVHVDWYLFILTDCPPVLFPILAIIHVEELLSQARIPSQFLH